MKPANTHNDHKAGMTLLELTVVILVLLSLISILFIGAKAWKKGSDRAGCVIQIRNVQQGVRSYANMSGFNPGSTVAAWKTLVIGSGLFVETTPACLGGGSYTYATDTTIPAVGTLAMTCSKSAAPDNHVPANYSGW
jgi:type II secretory pathway pseudopilin PulG